MASTYTKGGWWAQCSRGRTYWVSDRDITKGRMQRYDDDQCQQRHECECKR